MARRSTPRGETSDAQGISREEGSAQLRLPISEMDPKPLCTPQDLEELDYQRDLGLPGQFPYTRGIHPTMYRGQLWTMRQYAGFGTAEESNQRYRYMLEQGQTGLSVAFDLPTQMGYDSDDRLAEGEVGKVGVAIDTLEDVEDLLRGIPLDRVSTSMTINATASILLALYMAVAKKQGVPLSRIRGTIQNDILKEYIARGTYIYPPRPSMRLVTDVFAYCAEHLPQWNTINVSGYHIREAGATAVQELAFTLCDAVAYVEAAKTAGLSVDQVGPRLGFFFDCHINFFEEVAKFRAARRIWAKIMRYRFGAQDPRSWALRFHTQTAGCSLTAQQVDNNVVRTTLEALAAVLGGTQSLHTNAKDEALALPSQEAAEVALRTQQIIAHESGVTDVVDPLGGSYYVELLTNEMERRAQEYVQRVDAMGGALRAVENGYFRREIQESAYRYQRQVESGQRVTVGVNQFASQEQRPSPPLLRVNPVVQDTQSERLRRIRASRDSGKVAELLGWLERAARGTENTVPVILACVESYVTLGEICTVLRGVFGEARDVGGI